MNKISSKTFTSISQLPSVRIHGSLSMQECRDESEIYIYQWIQLSNNKFINVISGAGGVRLTWLDCNNNNVKQCWRFRFYASCVVIG